MSIEELGTRFLRTRTSRDNIMNEIRNAIVKYRAAVRYDLKMNLSLKGYFKWIIIYYIFLSGCSADNNKERPLDSLIKTTGNFTDQFENKLVLKGKPLNTLIIRSDSVIYYNLLNNDFYIANLNSRKIERFGGKLKNPAPFPFAFDGEAFYFSEYGGDEVVRMSSIEQDSILAKYKMFYPQGVKIYSEKMIVQCLNGLFIFNKKNHSQLLQICHTNSTDINAYIPTLIDGNDLYLAGILDSVHQYKGFSIYRIDLKGLKTVWKMFIWGEGKNIIVSDSSYIYVQTRPENVLYCINKKDGFIKWIHNIYSTLINPIPINRKLICESEEFIECLDNDSGKVVWRIKKKAENLYYFNLNNKLYIGFKEILEEVDDDTGETLKRFYVKEQELPVIVYDNNKFYMLLGNTIYW